MASLLGCSDSGDLADLSNAPPEGTISLAAENVSADSSELILSVTAWDAESNAVHILCASFDTGANHHTDYPFQPGDPYHRESGGSLKDHGPPCQTLRASTGPDHLTLRV